jgi:methyl-accepting chemotaxis protein
MDQTTQQNAALVEQAAAASQSILEQANELEKLIAGYKIEPTADVARQRQSVRDAA